MVRKRQDKERERGLDGPMFSLRGEEPLTVKSEFGQAKAQWERLGFELLASRASKHRAGGKEELFMLWRHPAGVLLMADTYHGRFVEDQYEPDFVHLNSVEIHWQANLGGGGSPSLLLGMRLDASSSSSPKGDGTYVGSYQKNYTQTGSWIDIFRQINGFGEILPLSQWEFSRVGFSSGLHWERASEGVGLGRELEPRRREEFLRSRQAFLESLPAPERAVLSREGSSPRIAPSLHEFNRHLSQSMLAAGVARPQARESERFMSWAQGEIDPSRPESLEPVGAARVGALHALACAALDPHAMERELAKMGDRDLARLANLPDARGVSPFLRCFELCRSGSSSISQSALALMEHLARRCGSELVCFNEKTSSLNLLLADAWPCAEGFRIARPEGVAQALQICADHAVPAAQAFFEPIAPAADFAPSPSTPPPPPPTRLIEGPQASQAMLGAIQTHGEPREYSIILSALERLALRQSAPAAAQSPRPRL